jgi:hypothetical protein
MVLYCEEAVLSNCECEKMKVPMHAQDLNGNSVIKMNLPL